MSDRNSDIAFLKTRANKLRDGAIEGINADKLPRLAAFIRDNPFGVTINSAYRSPEHQADILRQRLAQKNPELVNKWDVTLAENGGDVVKAGEAARPWLREAGVTKWVAPPGSSNHQKGTATDLRYANEEAKQWAMANAAKYSLAFPMAHEPWHVELAKSSGETLPTPTLNTQNQTPSLPLLAAPISAQQQTTPQYTDTFPTSGFDFTQAIAALANSVPPVQQAQIPQKTAMPPLRAQTPRVQIADRSGLAPTKVSLNNIFGT